MKQTTISQIKSFPIAHTDKGYFVYGPNGPSKEFLVKGQIVKSRAGLFFINIENEKFTIVKNSKFKVGETVLCIINPKIENEEIVNFIIKGLEKI